MKEALMTEKVSIQNVNQLIKKRYKKGQKPYTNISMLKYYKSNINKKIKE